MWKIKLQKIVGNLLNNLHAKIVHERNGHLDIFSRPQVKENSRQYLLLRTDILQKAVVGSPENNLMKVELFYLFELSTGPI